jgi:hypothetical protein
MFDIRFFYNYHFEFIFLKGAEVILNTLQGKDFASIRHAVSGKIAVEQQDKISD